MKKLCKLFIVYSITLTTTFQYYPVITRLPIKSVQYITAQPRKDDIQWRYKVENGNLYRRQYNASKQVWIGNWELC